MGFKHALDYLKILKNVLMKNESPKMSDAQLYKYRPILFMYEKVMPPSSFSWRKRGIVTTPHFQKNGSCYIYTSLTAVEALLKKLKLYKGPLNREELISYFTRNKKFEKGGSPEYPFYYLATRGVGLEADPSRKVFIEAYEYVYSEEDYAKVVCNQPLCVGVVASEGFIEHFGARIWYAACTDKGLQVFVNKYSITSLPRYLIVKIIRYSGNVPEEKSKMHLKVQISEELDLSQLCSPKLLQESSFNQVYNVVAVLTLENTKDCNSRYISWVKEDCVRRKRVELIEEKVFVYW